MRNAARLAIGCSVSVLVLAAFSTDASAARGSRSAYMDVVSVLERFLMRNDEGPVAYRALRRLEAHNQHFGANAWMDVWTEADQAGGFRYQVAAEGGSAYIRRKVFLTALDAEQKMWQEGEPKRAQLNHANYSFREDGRVDGGLASLEISPKRKDVLLVNGWLFVKQDDGDLVRIEGHLSKNPSFWTRHVEIVRRYGRVGGAHVPLEIESVAQILIAGRSTFRMTYEYESVNGRHVGDPKPRSSSASDSAK
jgi:hypothetical protein